MSATTSPSPSSSPVADHVPFATAAPEIDALCQRAIALHSEADYAASGALPLMQQVVDLAQAAMAANRTPPTALDVVFSMTELGLVKQTLGDLPGAQAVLEQAVALSVQTAGPAHTRIASALAQLGRVLNIRGRYEEADATLQRALTMQEELLGPEHQDVSKTLTHMGHSCISQGNFRRAKGLLKRAVAIAELHVAPDQHPAELTQALGYLCHVYGSLEDFAWLFGGLCPGAAARRTHAGSGGAR
jgi:tetratricopeptide (TPR) repeat protein